MQRLKCEVKDCKDELGPGSSTIGYEIEGRAYELKACEFHTYMVTRMPRGSWNITKDRRIMAIPATFFIKKGTP